MNTFQYAMRRYRLLKVEKFAGQPRSPDGILYYLGELIAAQNYSPQPYTPMTLIASGGSRHLVKLFVVERGVSANAAVQVFSHREGFYIPRPQFGTVDEERSLQVLDLVSQAIVMATSKDSLPKTNSGQPCGGALSRRSAPTTACGAAVARGKARDDYQANP